jgi:coproporphyrinogen III oxidase
MSMPPLARWKYNWAPKPGTPEADLYEHYLKPQNWLRI